MVHHQFICSLFSYVSKLGGRPVVTRAVCYADVKWFIFLKKKLKEIMSKFYLYPSIPWASLMVKNLPAVQKTWIQSLGQEDPLEKGMATHSSILAWRNPMDRVDATVHGVAELDSTEWLTLGLIQLLWLSQMKWLKCAKEKSKLTWIVKISVLLKL